MEVGEPQKILSLLLVVPSPEEPSVRVLGFLLRQDFTRADHETLIYRGRGRYVPGPVAEKEAALLIDVGISDLDEPLGGDTIGGCGIAKH